MIMSKLRHGNKLIPSTIDDVELGLALEERFLIICKLWMRVHGTELPIPESLSKDIYHWRQMRVRHNHNDFQHTESEKISVRHVAQWSVDINCELRNQERVVIDWGDAQ